MTDDTGAAMRGKPVLGIVVLILVIGVVVWLIASKGGGDTAQKAAETLSEAAEKVTVPAVKVPTSANVVKQVLPKATPLEKTNPFNKTYVNPFK